MTKTLSTVIFALLCYGLMLPHLLSAFSILAPVVNHHHPCLLPVSSPVGVASWRNSQRRLRSADDDESSLFRGPLSPIGIVAQPVVWLSLYYVATTGAGLPEGPFGLLGALEGVSYLVVLGWAVASVVNSDFASSSSNSGIAAKLSRVTIFLGIVTLIGLVGKQGCVPNAKPILDYSAYLPICDTTQTPGLFGM